MSSEPNQSDLNEYVDNLLGDFKPIAREIVDAAALAYARSYNDMEDDKLIPIQVIVRLDDPDIEIDITSSFGPKDYLSDKQ